MKKKFAMITAVICMICVVAGCGTDKKTVSRSDGSKKVISTEDGNYTDQYEEATNLTAGRAKISVSGSTPSDSQIKALTGADLALLEELIKQEKEGSNVLISPLSLNMALGMTLNGANGETLKQMEKAVGGDIKKEDYNEVMSYMIRKLNGCESVNWNVANSVWIKSNIGFDAGTDFLDAVNSYYESEVWRATFDSDTVNDMNDWCNDKTNGMIPKVIDNLDPACFMVLMNAIAFEGKWEEPYSKEDLKDNQRFFNADGSISEDVTMMKSSEERYISLKDGEGFVKPYKGGEYVFVGIVPKDGQSAEEYIRSVKEEDLAKAVRDAKKNTVHVRMPEFSLDYTACAVKDSYNKLGMELPFDQNLADFSNMTDNPGNGRNLYIGDIIHKTHIEVDAEGTKAAAVTAVMMECNAVAPMPDKEIYITLDRPFVYMIADAETGMPIFIGCQNTMAE